MNAVIAGENQNLLYDNKQLGALLKEYEQTLEAVMSQFRTRAVSEELASEELITYGPPAVRGARARVKRCSTIRIAPPASGGRTTCQTA